MAMIRIRELAFRYPGDQAFALDVPELELPSGACAAIVGPSGSGKTTLLSLTAGILLPQAGAISIGEVTVNELGDAARRRFRLRQVGQVFQAFELLDYLSVLENVLLARLIEARPDAAVRARALELLHSVGLGDMAKRKPAELSQGERQRVAVCRAMLNSPPLLLADEPTGNLDQANKQKVVDLLIEQARAHDSTLLMVTHDRSLLGAFERVIDFEGLAG